MVFQIKTYSVLLVSSAEKLNESIKNLLPVTDYWPVQTVKSVSEARRALAEVHYDLVIINTPLPDEFGSDFAIDVCSQSGAGVLQLVKDDLFENVYDKVMEYGVCVLAKPVSIPMITQSLKMLCTMRERIKKMEERQVSVEEKIAEIRLVNHAKWLLIEHQQISETDAQKYIEKMSMDRRISKKQVSEEIISKYSE